MKIGRRKQAYSHLLTPITGWFDQIQLLLNQVLVPLVQLIDQSGVPPQLNWDQDNTKFCFYRKREKSQGTSLIL